MVHVVHAANSAKFAPVLDQMFRDRARVVGDSVAADLPQVQAVRGKDRFDTKNATYLVHTNREGDRHLGSLRLLPTFEPHLLSVAGRVLCACGSPVAADIWELSWLCLSPHLAPAEQERIRGLLRLAVAEFAASRGIRQYTILICAQYLPEMLAAGWTAKPLGLPKRIGNLLVGAVLFTLTPGTLGRMRQQIGIHESVLGSTQTSKALSLEHDYAR